MAKRNGQLQPDVTTINYDELLQCPVCLVIPTGHIFQCNEGHHVCGRCKARLDVCPVCRALFFGTRNFAMEALISNLMKLRSSNLGARHAASSGLSESSSPVYDTSSGGNIWSSENDIDEEEANSDVFNQVTLRAPQPCKGLFPCLCCKSDNIQRFPSARLLNHLRYFHAPNLIEGKPNENGEYLQAWQFSSVPAKIVTAIRVAKMGIFFLTVEIASVDVIYAWIVMAASVPVAKNYYCTITLSGNDREALFSDWVLPIQRCEGFFKKHNLCMIVRGANAVALTASHYINCKISLRHESEDNESLIGNPRVAIRVASRGNNYNDNLFHNFNGNETDENNPPSDEIEPRMPVVNQNEIQTMSRAARRRMRRRLRAALNEAPAW